MSTGSKWVNIVEYSNGNIIKSELFDNMESAEKAGRLLNDVMKGIKGIKDVPSVSLKEIDNKIVNLWEAYKAGFMSSSEGWNGEYPFNNGKKYNDNDMKYLDHCFYNWLNKNDISNEEIPNS